MKFASKGTYMTNSVNQMFVDGEITPSQLRTMFRRHFQNDGEECKEDKKANQYAIDNKDGRVFSVFTVMNRKFYVITDGLHLENDPEYGKDYPCTTVMLSEDY